MYIVKTSKLLMNKLINEFGGTVSAFSNPSIQFAMVVAVNQLIATVHM